MGARAREQANAISIIISMIARFSEMLKSRLNAIGMCSSNACRLIVHIYRRVFSMFRLYHRIIYTHVFVMYCLGCCVNNKDILFNIEKSCWLPSELRAAGPCCTNTHIVRSCFFCVFSVGCEFWLRFGLVMIDS